MKLFKSLLVGLFIFGLNVSSFAKQTPIKEIISASDSQDLTGGVSKLINAVKSASIDEIISQSVDLSLLAANKFTDVAMKIDVESTKNALKSKIAGHLQGSALNNVNFSQVLKSSGINIIKSVIIGAVIETASDMVYEQTGSLAAREFVWLGLKNAEVYATSGGNPVSIAIGEAMILKEQINKNIEATKELIIALDDLETSKKNAERIDIEYEITTAAIKYAQAEDATEAMKIFNNTREKVQSMINNSDLGDDFRQELTNIFLNYDLENGVGGEYDIINMFKEIDNNIKDKERKEKFAQAKEAILAKYREQELEKRRDDILANYEEKQAEKEQEEAEQLAENEIVEATENKELTEKKQQAQELKNKNTKLIAEYNELYLEYVANPNATNKAKLDAKGDELNTNAREFVQARGEVIDLSGGTLAKNDIGFVDDVAITTRKINEDNPNLADDLAQNSENRAEQLAEIRDKILANAQKRKQVKQQLEARGELIDYVKNAKNKGLDNLTDVEQARLTILAKSFGNSDFRFLFKNINEIANTNQQQLNQLNTNQLNLDGILQNGGIVIGEGNINDFLSGIDEDILADFNDEVKDEIESESDDETQNNIKLYSTIDVGYIAFDNSKQEFRYLSDGAYEDDRNNAFSPIEKIQVNHLNGYIFVTPSQPSKSNPDVDGYEYSAWGRWESDTPIAVTNSAMHGATHQLYADSGYYIMGLRNRNPIRTGSASYKGTLMGDYIDNNQGGTIQKEVIGGDITLTANFDTSILNTKINATKNNNAWATANLQTDISAHGSFAHHNKQDGRTVIGGGDAMIFGSFYGENYNEIGGSFMIDKQHDDSGGAVGVFRAKQLGNTVGIDGGSGPGTGGGK